MNFLGSSIALASLMMLSLGHTMHSGRQDGVMMPFPTGEVPYLTESIQIFPLSENELVVLAAPAKQQGSKFIDRLTVRELHVFRVSLNSKTCVRVPSLEQAITEWPWFGFSLSPSGNRLLCIPIDRSHPGRIVNLANPAFKPFNLMTNSEVAWMRGTNSLLNLAVPTTPPPPFRIDKPNRLMGLDRDGMTCVQTLNLGMPLESDAVVNQDRGTLIGSQPGGTVVFAALRSGSTPQDLRSAMEVSRFNITDDRLAQKDSFQFFLPEVSTSSESIRMNSLGTRILWHAWKLSKQGEWDWILHCSNLDGSEMRDLLSIPMRKVQLTLTAPAPLTDARIGFQQASMPVVGAEWMPDGSRVVVIANGSIYLIKDPYSVSSR